jgi:predicted TIM-barrel fold metal-dependent hydrolase
MIIDFHTHCFPDNIASGAVASLAAKAGIPAMSDGTVEGIRSSMKAAGIDKSVVLSIATKPNQCGKITGWSSLVQDDGIIAFGSVHPDFECWRDELARMKEAGLKGIKFHPDYQDFFADDKKMYAIYEKAAEMDFVIVFHAGVDIGFPEPYHCMPERMRRVVKAFPGAKFVAAHMGGYASWDDVERFLVGEDIFLDTSYSLHKMDREQFIRIVSQHGHEKILFGTDSPWGDQSTELERLRNIGLPEDVRDAILGGNAAKLLGLTC